MYFPAKNQGTDMCTQGNAGNQSNCRFLDPEGCVQKSVQNILLNYIVPYPMSRAFEAKSSHRQESRYCGLPSLWIVQFSPIHEQLLPLGHQTN